MVTCPAKSVPNARPGRDSGLAMCYCHELVFGVPQPQLCQTVRPESIQREKFRGSTGAYPVIRPNKCATHYCYVLLMHFARKRLITNHQTSSFSKQSARNPYNALFVIECLSGLHRLDGTFFNPPGITVLDTIISRGTSNGRSRQY